MPASRQVTRINTLEMKTEMELKLGRSKADFYFCLLTKFLSLKISKLDFNTLCVGTIGKENLHLHNKLIRSIVKNATLSVTAPPKPSEKSSSLSVAVPNGFHKESLNSLCRDFPQSPRKGRTPSFRDRRFKDRPSPLGPQGKSHCAPCEVSPPTRAQEQHSASELFSLGSRPPSSDEDSEEVEQGNGNLELFRKIPLVAPLGVLEGFRTRRKLLTEKQPDFSGPSDTCQRNGSLPGTSSLIQRLKTKIEREGLSLSEDCANVLVSALDVYMKSLMKPCLELAASRSGNSRGNGQLVHSLNGVQVNYAEKTSAPATASVLDFRVAMEANPTILGQDWPRKLEKICFYESEDRSRS